MGSFWKESDYKSFIFYKLKKNFSFKLMYYFTSPKISKTHSYYVNILQFYRTINTSGQFLAHIYGGGQQKLKGNSKHFCLKNIKKCPPIQLYEYLLAAF